MKTISKEITGGRSFVKKQGVVQKDSDGNPVVKKEWKGGEIVFNVDFSDMEREDLERLVYNSAKDHLQYGASTAWRNAGGELKDSTSGRFLVKDGVFSFNPKFKVGEHTSKKQEQIAAAIEEELRRAAQFQLALEDWDTVDLKEITAALPKAQVEAIRDGIVNRFK